MLLSMIIKYKSYNQYHVRQTPTFNSRTHIEKEEPWNKILQIVTLFENKNYVTTLVTGKFSIRCMLEVTVTLSLVPGLTLYLV